MVGLVKRSLRAAIGRKLMTHDELQTTLCEVESIVNSRPLTYVYNDINEPQPLRPSDFLSPRLVPAVLGSANDPDEASDPTYRPKNTSADTLQSYWKQQQKAVDHFWKRWQEDYLKSLRERMQMNVKQGKIVVPMVPKIGSVVLVENKNMPRSTWQIARITKLYPSADDAIRSAEVFVNGNHLKRSIAQLYPLEIDYSESEQLSHQNDTASTNEDIAVKQDNQELKVDQKTNDPTGTNQPRRSARLAAQHKATQHIMFVALLSLLFLPSTLAETANGACKNGSLLHLIESETCVKTGVAVYNESGNLCWKKFECKQGTVLTIDGECHDGNEHCHCPNWSQGCAIVTEETNKRKMNTWFYREKPMFCSSQPDPDCSDTPVVRKFPQIELLNGTKVLVRQLHIKVSETTSSLLRCIGTGPRTGTPEFCETHSCVNVGTQLCYYTHTDVAMFITDQGLIQIKAWGYVEKTVYGQKFPHEETSSCVECSIECAPHGLKVTTANDTSLLEVCIKPICLRKMNPKHKETVLLSPELTMHTHVVDMTVWTKGHKKATVQKTCHAYPFCDSVKCTFCFQSVTNPQCSPTNAIVAMVVLVMKINHRCKQHHKKKKEAQEEDRGIEPQEEDRGILELQEMSSPPVVTAEISNYEYKPTPYISKRALTTTTMTVLTTVLLLGSLGTSEACAVTSTITAKSSECHISNTDRQLQCVVNEAISLSLAPSGQKSCLSFESEEGQIMGSLEVEVESIVLKCDKRNRYYTRSFNMGVQAVKRCPSAGSCCSDTCATTKYDTEIEELKGRPYETDGFTRCTDSCSCWACQCFICSSACLFWRTFVDPASSTVFEIFDCPDWNYEVKIKAELHQNTKSDAQEFRLIAAEPQKWSEEIVFTVTSLTKPEMPILGTSFLTDNRRIVIVEPSPAGQPVTGRVGQLQCGTKEKAETLKGCDVAMDSCQCEPADLQVNCLCNEFEVEKLFLGNHVLPVEMNGMILMPYESTVIAEYHENMAVELQIQTSNYHLLSTVDKNTCTIEISHATGCYSCLTGFEVAYVCTSDQTEAAASVKCENGIKWTARCSTVGTKVAQKVHTAQRKVETTCTVNCGAESTEFQLQATLISIEHGRLGELSNRISQPSTISTTAWPSNYFSAFLNANKWLIYAAIGIVGVIIICFIGPPAIQCLLSVQQCCRMITDRFKR